MQDDSGVSGTGKVAEGVVFSSGWCALNWLTSHQSLGIYPSLREVEDIHGHCGKTEVSFQVPAKWLSIPGYENYEVSSLGQVRNIKSGRLLKPAVDRYGYIYFTLSGKKHKAHRLVLSTFHPQADSSHLEVRHMDGDQMNNRVENLCWGTRSQNEQDKKLHGTDNAGERNNFAKLSEQNVLDIRALFTTRSGTVRQFFEEMADRFMVSVSAIKKLIYNETWTS